MTRRFRRFEPPKLDSNRSLPPEERLFFAISLKPTAEGLAAVKQAFASLEMKASREKAEAVAKALAPFVRLGAGDHSIEGKPIRNLADYLEIGFARGNDGAYRDLVRAAWRDEEKSRQ